MGQEIECRVEYQGGEHKGRALLETDELLFRGAFKLKIPRREITGVVASDGRLAVTFGRETAIFHVGAAAPKWAEKILYPPSRLDKLCVKRGSTYRCLGPADSEFLAELQQAGAVESDQPEIIFLSISEKDGLKGLEFMPGKAVWIIYPKGLREVTENDVIKAGRSAGLVDIKVVRYSATHTALKFVGPRAAARKG